MVDGTPQEGKGWFEFNLHLMSDVSVDVFQPLDNSYSRLVSRLRPADGWHFRIRGNYKSKLAQDAYEAYLEDDINGGAIPSVRVGLRAASESYLKSQSVSLSPSKRSNTYFVLAGSDQIPLWSGCWQHLSRVKGLRRASLLIPIRSNTVTHSTCSFIFLRIGNTIFFRPHKIGAIMIITCTMKVPANVLLIARTTSRGKTRPQLSSASAQRFG